MKEKANLKTPMSTMVAMPRYQVAMPASYSLMPLALKLRKAGPSTASAMPMEDGVSRPSGMAVTFALPVFLARRKAIQV